MGQAYRLLSEGMPQPRRSAAKLATHGGKVTMLAAPNRIRLTGKMRG